MLRLFILLSFFTTLLFSSPVWVESLETARLKAKKENKLIFMMFSKEPCQACWYMKHIVLEKKMVKDALDKDYVCVYVDIKKEIPKGFDYIGTPTFYFLDSDANLVHPRREGSINTKDFLEILNQVIEKRP